MLISFYDNNFNALQDNATLLVDNNSFELIKRPIEVNDFSCVCEKIGEDIHPTFVVLKDNYGSYVYGSFAGVPLVNEENKTTINATDLKSYFASDIILQYGSGLTNVKQVIEAIFEVWDDQVNQGSFNCELVFRDYSDYGSGLEIEDISLDTLTPDTSEQAVYDAYEELSAYCKAYDLYIDSELDLVNKKIIYTIGRTMVSVNALSQNIRLFETNVLNYGKWVADINETQGYYDNGVSWTAGNKWILTSNNELTLTESNRDIYPIKRRVFTSTDSMEDAETQAITELLNARYNENIDLAVLNFTPTFETRFCVYVNRGEEIYKELPCGELRYNYASFTHDDNRNVVQKPYEVQIGYRYTGVDFI